MELVRALYNLGDLSTVAKVAPQLFASVLVLKKDTSTYGNVLNWLQASFNNVVWKKHSSLFFQEGPIRTSPLWKASNFAANSLEGRQAAEFIQGWFLGRYGAPFAPADTTSARVAPMAKAASHVARNGVGARVVWGNDPCANLGGAGAEAGARGSLVLTSVGRAVVRNFTLGSGSG